MQLHIVVTMACVAMLSTGVYGHAYLKVPASRNVLANSDYCPHCLNAGGPGIVYESDPNGKAGLCGDIYNTPTPRNHEAGGKYWKVGEGKPTATYTEGDIIEVTSVVTAYHKGRLGFRVCKIMGTSIEDETEQLTEDCFESGALRQADVPEAQSPGDLWYHLGPSPENYAMGQSLVYTAKYQLPNGLNCDGIESKCVLQFYYLTGNSCNPPDEPFKYTGNNGLATCGDANAAKPEEFWNCADIVIKPSDAPNTPSDSPSPTSPPSPTATVAPPPSPTATVAPTPSPTPAATLPPAVPPTTPPTTTEPTKAPKEDTGDSENGDPKTFCAAKDSYGYFADKSSGCKTFYRCEPTGSWKFECPPNLLFDENSGVCNWANSVDC